MRVLGTPHRSPKTQPRFEPLLKRTLAELSVAVDDHGPGTRTFGTVPVGHAQGNRGEGDTLPRPVPTVAAKHGVRQAV